MKTSHCRTCNAPIVWLKTSRGKNIPVDVESFEAVEFEMDAPEFDPKSHVSHFSTCPDADSHRR